MTALTASAFRRRSHPAYVAFVVHRLSGLLLALFLPLHFLALGQAIYGDARLQSFLRLTDNPLTKFAEFGLVV
ncbi:MAG: succinate dehydrogenase, partial [Microvirga sp.]